jgi:hypothetical protein
VSAGITKSGTTQVQFQGHNYSLTSYSLRASLTDNSSSSSLQGTLATFPSGLIQSVNVTTSLPTGNGSMLASPLGAASASISVKLLSTSLPLNAGTASATAQAASIGIGAGAAVSALAIGLGVRHRNKQKETVPEQKPAHWVD